MSAYKIRAHHGMCLPFFRGACYSGAFVENMTRMKKILAENPEIRLVAGSDDICAACPNRETQACAEKACRYDRQVLDRCGMTPGDRMHYLTFSALVEKAVLRPGKRTKICGDCQWSSLCVWKEERP